MVIRLTFMEKKRTNSGPFWKSTGKHSIYTLREALASVGATMDDVIKITTYLTDISRYGEFSKARTEAFPNGVPASTAVATPALVLPELLVEIEAMAVIGSGAG